MRHRQSSAIVLHTRINMGGLDDAPFRFLPYMLPPDSFQVAELQARFLSAITNSNRLKILLILRKGEVPVGRLAVAISLTPAGISQHLSILREAGMVAARREGQVVYYHLTSKELGDLIARFTELFSPSFR